MEKGFWTRIGTAFQNQDGSWNLRFDYLPTTLADASERLSVQVSPDGVGWVEVGDIPGPADDTVFTEISFDIAPWSTALTRIRLLAVGLNWRPVTARAAVASIGTGLGLNLGLEALARQPWFASPLPDGVIPSAVALAASFLVLVAFSLMPSRLAEKDTPVRYG